MKTAMAAVSVTILLLSVPAAASDGREEKPFAAGGHIRLDLSAGDYIVKAGRADRIAVEWRTPSDASPARISITTDNGGKTATVLTSGPHNNFKVVIEVPSLSDLNLNVSAGDLRVLGITGNKNLGSWAGDIDVDVPRSEDYRRVDVHVTAGDISAPSFGGAASGLFRSFTWNGPGQYTLQIRLTAGDVRLYATATDDR